MDVGAALVRFFRGPIIRCSLNVMPQKIRHAGYRIFAGGSFYFDWTGMSAAGQEVSKDELDLWFMDQVVPLEPMLMRFLRRNHSPTAELSDIRQDVYIRVYEAARKGLPAQAKPFLFAVARNLMIDQMRRRQILSIETVTDFEGLNVPAIEATPEREVSAREELRILQAALDEVPARQREAILLRKVQGLSQRDVALRMGITEDTVERHLSKGVRFLAEAVMETDIGACLPRIGLLTRKKSLKGDLS